MKFDPHTYNPFLEMKLYGKIAHESSIYKVVQIWPGLICV